MCIVAPRGLQRTFWKLGTAVAEQLAAFDDQQGAEASQAGNVVDLAHLLDVGLVIVAVAGG